MTRRKNPPTNWDDQPQQQELFPEDPPVLNLDVSPVDLARRGLGHLELHLNKHLNLYELSLVARALTTFQSLLPVVPAGENETDEGKALLAHMTPEELEQIAAIQERAQLRMEQAAENVVPMRKKA